MTSPGHAPAITGIGGQTASNATASNAALNYLASLHPQNAALSHAALLQAGLDVDAPGADALFPVVHIDMRAPSAEAIAFASANGLSLDLLRRIGADLVGDALADDQPDADPVRHAEEAAFLDILHRVMRDFARRRYIPAFFRAGGLVSLDPFTGTRLVSSHSLLLDDHHIAYVFQGAETFHVVVGGLGGVIRHCSIPRLNCLVTMPNAGEDDRHVEWSHAVHRTTLRKLVQHGVRAARPGAEPRRAAGVCIGFTNNLGHTIWQDIAGLQDILEQHGAGAVSHVLQGPYAVMPVKELFPELAHCELTEVPADSPRFLLGLDLPYQHIRPLGLMIRPALRERINRVVDAFLTPELASRIAAAGQGRFVVWITLRANLKVWTQQVDGHVAALRRLARDVGPMTVILDGWSNTRADADRIRAALEPEGIEIADILGCGFQEAVLWARSAQLYSAVVGSGLFVNSYFADRPGVAHANTIHLQQALYWAALCPGSCAPTFLDKNDIQDDGTLFANYDFDPSLLYRKLLDLARQHYPDRLRPRTPGYERVVDLRDDGPSAAIRTSGLSVGEFHGTWTDGQRATIMVPGFIGAVAGGTLSVSVYPNIIAGWVERQRLAVRIDGHVIWEGSVTEPCQIAASVPGEILQGSGVLNIEFDLPDALAPLATGLSSDARALGVMLQTIVLCAEPA